VAVVVVVLTGGWATEVVVAGGFVVAIVVTSVVDRVVVVVVSATRATEEEEEEEDVDRMVLSGADSGIRSPEPQPVTTTAVTAKQTSSWAPRLTRTPFPTSSSVLSFHS
jgi:hypothetical protein